MSGKYPKICRKGPHHEICPHKFPLVPHLKKKNNKTAESFSHRVPGLRVRFALKTLDPFSGIHLFVHGASRGSTVCWALEIWSFVRWRKPPPSAAHDQVRATGQGTARAPTRRWQIPRLRKRRAVQSGCIREGRQKVRGLLTPGK